VGRYKNAAILLKVKTSLILIIISFFFNKIQGVGTACWLAPEVINFAHASKDSDVYAFGIVLDLLTNLSLLYD
jgi:serine/threonine protein kinase